MMKKRVVSCLVVVLMCGAMVIGCQGLGDNHTDSTGKIVTDNKKNEGEVKDKKELAMASDKNDELEAAELEKGKEEDKVAPSEKENNDSTKKSANASETRSSSAGNNKSTQKPSNTNNTSTTKTSTNTNNNSSTTKKPSSPNSTNNTQKPTSTNNSNKQHSHSWNETYKVVHHEAVYEQKWVQDTAAWDEIVPIYENVEKSICNQCGLDVTGFAAEHAKKHALAGENSGHHSEWDYVQTGTKTIHHEATGHNEQVLVKAAYDEKVRDGFVCSTCGAKK